MTRVFWSLIIAATSHFAEAQRFDAKRYFELKDSVAARLRRRDLVGAQADLGQLTSMNRLRGENWTQLAKVAYTLGQWDSAIAAFQEAFELKDGIPYFTAYYIAVCYAQKKDTAQSLAWLKKSFGLGFESIDEIKDDPTLALLKNNPDFRKMVGIRDFSGSTRGEALSFELSLLKREVKRVLYYPDRVISLEKFEAIIDRIKSDLPHLSENQYAVRLMQAMALLGDGHTHAFPDWRHPGKTWYLPVRFFKFSEGVFITETDSAHRSLLGARVMGVGNIPIDSAWRTLATIANHDNEFGLNEGIAFLIRCPQLLEGLGIVPSDQAVQFRMVLANGVSQTLAIRKDSFDVPDDHWCKYYKTLPGTPPLYLDSVSRKFWFKKLHDPEMMYVQFNQVFNDRNETFADFCDRLSAKIRADSVRTLVLDMRWNNGGNGYLAKPLLEMINNLPAVNKKGHFFVIIGRKTFSAAMITTALIERFTHAIFVGEQTGSSPNFVGEDNHFTLPYSKVDICLSTRFHENSWADDHRPWIAPEIYTPPSFAYYQAGRDPALEAIIEYCRKNAFNQ